MNQNNVFRVYLVQTQKDLEFAVQRYQQSTGYPPTKAIVSHIASENLVRWLGEIPGLHTEMAKRGLPLDVWLTHDA